MSNIITKAPPVPDMHSTGLRVVGAWLFAIVLILFSTVFVHIPYTREIQMVLAIPVLLFFGAPFYTGAWKGTRSGRNNIDRLVALTTSVAFLFSVFNTFFPDYWLGIGLEPHVYYEASAVIIAFVLTGKLMEERAKGNTSTAIRKLMGMQPKAARVLRNGVEEEILIENRENCIRIPMWGDIRSLNLSNSVAIVLYEALRQNGFEKMTMEGHLHHLHWKE